MKTRCDKQVMMETSACSDSSPVKTYYQTVSVPETLDFSMDQAILEQELASLEKKLHKACDQLESLQDLENLTARRHQKSNIKRTKLSGRVNNSQMKLCVVRGVRSMYYEYASRVAAKIAEISQQMAPVYDE